MLRPVLLPECRCALAFCGLLLSGFCPPSPAADVCCSAHWQAPAYLVDSFVDIALNNEHAGQKSTLRKWMSPIHYFVIHRVADQELHDRLIRTHFEQLSEITGLTIKPAERQQTANTLIVLSTENQLKDDLLNYFGWQSATQREKFFRESVCLGIFATKADSTIFRAVVIIPVDRARAQGKLVACMVEELAQVLGLPNDSVKVFPSVFNDLSTDVYLSGLDWLLLKMLYDPRLKPGMQENAARPVLRRIVDDLKRDNKIHTAEKEVMSRGLWRLER
ncbi:MAG: DUF2927 domain-containing protein [Betaproteobacteria bacterium]|nr:DUF2927 domain-containing protein [Betaproteobacteria bacterium]